jgi:hypothetical protein
MANGEWRIEKYHSLFAIRYSPFADLYSLFAIRQFIRKKIGPGFFGR